MRKSDVVINPEVYAVRVGLLDPTGSYVETQIYWSKEKPITSNQSIDVLVSKFVRAIYQLQGEVCPEIHKT